MHGNNHIVIQGVQYGWTIQGDNSQIPVLSRHFVKQHILGINHGYSPLNCAVRFSKNAATPSVLSFVVQHRPKCDDSISNASAKERSEPVLMVVMILCMAMGPN